ncbi:hypothetical protein BGZ47_001432 [Haplosporangium gracile]|nr:hypothetical protein BGZ47_001432 [Haplosporangium gracile]
MLLLFPQLCLRDHISTMDSDHPIRALKLGTVQANVKRAIPFARKVNEIDKLILRNICPDFTVEEVIAFNDSTNQQQSVGQRQDQEHDQGSQSKYNEQESFLQTLLNTIMNSTQPGATMNMRRTTVNVELAREFFNSINLKALRNSAKRVCGRHRCLVPMSSMKDKFITLTELELVVLFWRNPALKCELQHMAFGDYTTIRTPAQVQADVRN